MAEYETNQQTADVINSLKLGEKTQADFNKSKKKLAAQGVDVGLVDRFLTDTGVSVGQRSKMSFGNRKGVIRFLQKEGFEARDFNGSYQVKRDNVWKEVDPKGFRFGDIPGDIADIIGYTLPYLGLSAGATIGAPTGGAVPAGALGGMAGEAGRQAIGARLGTQSEIDPLAIAAEGAKDVAAGAITKYAVTPALAKAGGLAGKAREAVGGVVSKVFPKKSIYTIGKKAQAGINLIKKIGGKAVFDQKQLVLNMKDKIVDTRPILQHLNTELAGLGDYKKVLSAADVRAIDYVKAQLASGKASPRSLQILKDTINNKYVSYKTGQTIKPVTDQANRILSTVVNGSDVAPANASINGIFNNLTPELTKINSKYHTEMQLYEQGRKLFGNDLRIESQLPKAIEGSEAHKIFYNNLNKALPKQYQFMDDLTDVVYSQSFRDALRKAPITGYLAQFGDIGVAGRRLGMRKLGKLGTGIATSPLTARAAEEVTLHDLIEQRLNLNGGKKSNLNKGKIPSLNDFYPY